MQEMHSQTKLFRILALCGNLGLLSWVFAWQFYISPHPHINNIALAVAWSIPLLLPIPGILVGKPYTHVWANFFLMLYFLHAFTILYIDDGERWLAAVELALTGLAFVSNILFARTRGQELGLKLERLSKVEKEEKQRFE